jgi:hypothetical protein
VYDNDSQQTPIILARYVSLSLAHRKPVAPAAAMGCSPHMELFGISPHPVSAVAFAKLDAPSRLVLQSTRETQMKNLFLLLRVLTGLSVSTALVVLLAIVLLRSGAAFMKGSVGVVGYVAQLFTSGFTKGTTPPPPRGWVIGLPQVGMAALFVAMIVSLFHPEARISLHIIAAVAGVAVIWYVRMMLTEVKLEILCLPLLAVWFFYYATCLFWSGNQPILQITGP